MHHLLVGGHGLPVQCHHFGQSFCLSRAQLNYRMRVDGVLCLPWKNVRPCIGSNVMEEHIAGCWKQIDVSAITCGAHKWWCFKKCANPQRDRARSDRTRWNAIMSASVRRMSYKKRCLTKATPCYILITGHLSPCLYRRIEMIKLPAGIIWRPLASRFSRGVPHYFIIKITYTIRSDERTVLYEELSVYTKRVLDAGGRTINLFHVYGRVLICV